MRDMIFLSHANPEDNEIARWISLRLAQQGYPIWCDLTKLLGGEDFWRDVEQAIRQRTSKFLYVLSEKSNEKDGPLNELHIALNVKRDANLGDFVIPLLIDDLSPRQINIEISRLNVIQFNKGWEKGLHQLVKKLEADNVSKKPNFTPNAVSSWWQNYFGSAAIIKNEPEEYLSNRFIISRFPDKIYFHSFEPSQSIVAYGLPELPYPSFLSKRFLITFAPIEDFNNSIRTGISLSRCYEFTMDKFVREDIEHNISRSYPAKKMLSILLRRAWDTMIKAKGLRIYSLSDHSTCAYFPKGLIKNDSITFKYPNCRKVHRSIVGYKSIFNSRIKQKTIRYWHFAVQARPQQSPFAAYVIKPHIIFTDDGITAWGDKKRMHVARRSQCWDWWNDDWRDRILACMNWLAGNTNKIEIPLGREISVYVDTWPVVFRSPVSFEDPAPPTVEEIEEELVEDDLEENLVDGSEITDE